MGISTEQWRMRIGLFGSRSRGSGTLSFSSRTNLLSTLLVFAVISTLLFIGNVELNPGPFPCKNCDIITDNIASSLQHQHYHAQNSNFKFYCPSPECVLSSSSFGTVRTHVSIYHRSTKHRIYPALDPAPDVIDTPDPHQCKVSDCVFSEPSLWDLVQHYYSHLDNGVEVPCPLISVCNFEKIFHKKSTFQVHLSQYHKGWNPHKKRKTNNDQENGPTAARIQEDQDQDSYDPREGEGEGEGEGDIGSHDELFEDTSFLDDDLVLDYIAKFYLQLYGIHFLPYDTIQDICDGLTFITEIMHARFKKVLISELERIQVSEEDVKRICYKIMSTDLLYSSHHKVPGTESLCTDYFRKKYFEQNLGYRPPIEISLDNNNPKSDKKYQYVPIEQTFETILQDPTVQKEIDESFVEQAAPVDSGNVSNYTEGTQFKTENHPPEEIHLMMYQDGFNPVMNVLGSAKNKFKALAVYFTLGNLKPVSRSKVASKHLVMLIRESVMKDVGPEKCFERLTRDLKRLEATGIKYKDKIVKVIVEFFIGDNLGQHFIGGFIGSFSSTYFCRYCIIKKKFFISHPAITNPPITKEKYKQCVWKATMSGKIIQGIKQDSTFNSLKYFHSTTSLAPCIAHDLFEGCISWDLSAIISILVEQKWFSYNLLNRRIRHLCCKGTDLPNKPAYVRSKGDKLGGHAVQNWTLLRLLPFILRDKIKDTEHEAWKLYLQLKELCQIFCAPKFSSADVPYIKDVLLPAYFERRAAVVVDEKKYPLKPKHHYMSHYPELMLKFGPLIHLWSLPYEQMHKLFKTVSRLSRNFKNSEYTCAVRHQMHLAYLGTGPLFPKEISEAGVKPFLLLSYSEPILPFLRTLSLGTNWNECKTLHINGLKYQENDLLLISPHSEFCISVGIIKIILTQGSKVEFILERFVAVLDSDFGVYKIPTEGGQFVQISRESLCYPVAQPLYNFQGFPSFSLKCKLT